jgi:predicted site-specific integrase-resolvase
VFLLPGAAASGVHVSLKEWAEQEGVAYVTARRWLAAGKLPVPARKVDGLILVTREQRPDHPAVVVYARVSSAGQETDLDRQVARVTSWATSNGMSIDRVVTEVGPALNGKREKFLALLRDPSVATIVAEHPGRFAASVSRASKPRCRRRNANWWSLMKPNWKTTWCAT